MTFVLTVDLENLRSYHCAVLQQLQKLLFSATLSHNPEKLEELNLFMPRLMTSGMISSASETVSSIPVQSESGSQQESSVGKYTTPQGLKVCVYNDSLRIKRLKIHEEYKC
jgi:ATP-dependent RNA helicase DDX51/DBP6